MVLRLPGSTPNQLASFAVVKEQFAALRRDFDQLVGVDLPALEAKLGPAGVPWTPGRGANDERSSEDDREP